ncbi:hypothetical protein KL905_002406 [Ogataea polymorpha]|nr:hypothetical protein KL908_002108 [Ogataea polymorpha]KAG7906510.1 hypothetical protein KL907_002150 [Ogataea polymorpha]KAG7909757.1 hypothetical protein KL906_001662 [Ogataea polymorpha]KAG7917457.1 hypothetical protein KL927_002200 [Ogataea polymorpha]KAG7921641.1 hypothetical protein KL905_002406 [Ogataea polymorpha]
MPHPCTELDPDQHQDASRLVSSRKILNGHRICGLRFQHIREVFFVCGCDKPAGFGQTDALIDVLVLVHGERLVFASCARPIKGYTADTADLVLGNIPVPRIDGVAAIEFYLHVVLRNCFTPRSNKINKRRVSESLCGVKKFITPNYSCFNMSKKWIDKKTAQSYALLHRAHEDPLYYDEEAGERVLVPIEKSKRNVRERLETKQDLQKELDSKIAQGDIRKNEGEAALYGITYDDSQYDYMQHLKPIGEDKTGIFIAREDKPKKVELPTALLPSKETVKYDYQRQQNIQDEIAGFKPDMNPDLREVLEALEDEAYIDPDQDEDDVDVFGTLLGGKPEVVKDSEYEEYDEWDMDNYEDEYGDYDSNEEGENFDWEKDFSRFKKEQSRTKVANDWDSDDEFDDEDEVGSLPDLGATAMKSKSSKKKERRRKGAKTDTSSYSMSSSALCRTEQMTIIDDKFDVMKERYEQDEEEEYEPFAFENERQDLAALVDDFLDNYTLEKGGRKIVKKDRELEKIQRAADSVSQSKLALRRKKASNGGDVSTFKGLADDMRKLRM